jgi:hypothetical protein
MGVDDSGHGSAGDFSDLDVIAVVQGQESSEFPGARARSNVGAPGKGNRLPRRRRLHRL